MLRVGGSEGAVMHLTICRTARFVSFASLFVAFILLNPQPLHADDKAQMRSQFRANSRLVVVDVVITDAAGRVVHGLKTQDFKVMEDGKAQVIIGFEEHGSDTGPKPKPAIPNLLKNEYTNYVTRNDPGALNVLLLDTLNSSHQDLASARSEMLSFLKKLPPGRKVALYTLGSELRMVQGFTDDTDTLIAAAQQLSTRSHPLYSNNRELSAALAEPKETKLVKSPAALRALLRFLTDDYEGKLEVRSQDTLDALTQVARALAVVPGRKNLIWISGGFPFDSLTNGDRLQRVSALLAATRIAVYPVDLRGMQSMQADGQTRDSEIFAATQTQVYETIAHLDEENRTLIETMQNVAKITGGHAYVNRNDLDRAMADAVENGSSYYTLAYRPTNDNWNGSFRKITVKTARSGVRTLYRNGYYAVLDPLSTKEDPSWVAGFAMRQDVPVSTQLIMKARVVPPDDAGKPVLVDILLDAHDLAYRATPEKQRPEVQFIAVAWDSSGKQCGSFSESFSPALSQEQLQKLLRNGMQFHQPMTLPSGSYQLRLGVVDRVAGRVGTLDVPLVIEAKEAAK
jgi:VWFA-related protein